MSVWSVYILRCKGDRLYTGISTDVGRRLTQHMRGVGAKFTRAHPPIELLGECACQSHGDALSLEHYIKQLTPAAKRELALSWKQAQQAKSAQESQ